MLYYGKTFSIFKDIDYKGIGASELTEDEVKYISARYNLGSGRTLDEIKNTCGYG